MMRHLVRLVAVLLLVPLATPASPAATAAPPFPDSRTDLVAVTGSDDALWVRTTSGPWQWLGGRLVDAPSVAVGDHGVYFVGLGGDGNVWVRSLERGWQPLGPVGTRCAGPAAMTSLDRLAVGCRGEDGALWVSDVVLAEDGSLPRLPGWRSLGGRTGHGVSVADAGDGYSARFTWFVVGTDRGGWMRAWTGEWMPGREGNCAGTLAVSEFLEASACPVYASPTTQWLDTYDYTSVTQDAEWRPAYGSIKGRPAVAVDTSWIKLYYAVGADDAVWVLRQEANGSLSGWHRLGGTARHGVSVVNLS